MKYMNHLRLDLMLSHFLFISAIHFTSPPKFDNTKMISASFCTHPPRTKPRKINKKVVFQFYQRTKPISFFLLITVGNIMQYLDNRSPVKPYHLNWEDILVCSYAKPKHVNELDTCLRW